MQILAWQHEDLDVKGGTLCDVAGWGVDSYTGRRPDLLKNLTVPVMDRATCNLRIYHDGTITDSMMCTESHYRRDSCKVRGARRAAGSGDMGSLGSGLHRFDPLHHNGVPQPIRRDP